MRSKKELNKGNNIIELEFTGGRVVLGKTPYVTHQEHINRYVFASRFIKNKIVLDVASGTGYGSDYLIKKGAKKVIGLDISNDAINYGKNAYEKQNLSVMQGNATNLPFHDESFDIIVSFETIEHLKEYRKFLIECRRVLKNEGLFICSTPNKRVSPPSTKKPLNPFHVKEFYPEEFYELLNEYFANIGLYGQCDINLIKRRIVELGGEILSIIPNENAVKSVIKKFILSPSKSSCKDAELRGKKLNKIVDEDYEISKFKNNKVITPAYIIAIAKKVKVKGETK